MTGRTRTATGAFIALAVITGQLSCGDSASSRGPSASKSSVPLGDYSIKAYVAGRDGAAKYHVALGSAREMLACLEIAEAFGYVGAIDAELRGEFDRVIGSLVRLVERG